MSVSTGGDQVEAESVCISGLSPSGGAYDASFWHTTTIFPPGVDFQYLDLQVSFSASSTCDVLTLAGGVGDFVGDNWQQETAVVTAPPGTQSATLRFVLGCPFQCSNDSFDAYVDDVVLAPQQPTAVAVNSFAARRTSGGVALNWRTSSEVETLGFHVYRQQKGKLTRLSRTLIPSVFGGTAAGHRYSWLDRRTTARGVLRYRLQSVNLDGSRRWVGAATVAR